MTKPKKPKVYRGYLTLDGRHHVTVNGKPLRHVDYHGEEMAWGYMGSGAADTALSILANYFREGFVTGEYLHRLGLVDNSPKCWHYHQDFKREFVAGWSRGEEDRWELTSDQIAAWLEKQPAYEPDTSEQEYKDLHGRQVISFQDLF